MAIHINSYCSAAPMSLFIAAVFFILVTAAAAEEDDDTIVSIFRTNVGLTSNEGQIADARRSPRAAGRTCGQSKYPDAGNKELPTPRIVGGKEARPHEFPWQVSMQLNGRHTCGGSIVAPSWVLTAAHCIGDLTIGEVITNITITVGDHILDDTTSRERQTFHIVNLTMGNYNPDTLANDIMLLELNGSITFNENVTTICLPDPRDAFINQKSVASGWGVTYFGGRVASNTLLYTTLNTSSNEACDAVFFAKVGQRGVNPSIMCARDNIDDRTSSTCQGDSGGPLAVKGADGTFTVAGIVSWGVNCSAGFPGIFTRVSFYVDAIYNVTGIEPPPTKPTVPTEKITMAPGNSTKTVSSTASVVVGFTTILLFFSHWCQQ